MKKVTITLAMILTLVVNSFANDEKINPEVLNAFKTRFADAQDVTWTTTEDYSKATFTFHGAQMCAFYNTKAELVGVTRNILSTQLPLYLQNSFRRDYPGYWITGLFELSKRQGVSYYLSIRNADEQVVLRSSDGEDWEVYQTKAFEN
jgi:hypothetical protein